MKRYISTPLFSAAALLSASVLSFVPMTAMASGNSENSNAHQIAAKPAPEEKSMKFTIPQPLVAEHEELHAELQHAMQAGGRTGEAAKAVAEVLHPHFVKEEEYALPPLGLLPALASGEVSPDMAQVLPMTDKLKHELPQMLAEHKEIVAALERLKIAARTEHKPEIENFAQALVQHALTEEQVTYPTAILIGEYVKLKLGK